jgi:hypothetical protein
MSKGIIITVTKQINFKDFSWYKKIGTDQFLLSQKPAFNLAQSP